MLCYEQHDYQQRLLWQTAQALLAYTDGNSIKGVFYYVIYTDYHSSRQKT